MSVAEKTAVVQARPDKIWAIAGDTKNWPILFRPRFAMRMGNLEFVPESGTKFVLKSDGSPVSRWEINEWQPPMKWTATMLGGYQFRSPVNMSIVFNVEAVDTLDSKFTFRVELGFKTALGSLLDTIFSTRTKADRIADLASTRLVKLLEPQP